MEKRSNTITPIGNSRIVRTATRDAEFILNKLKGEQEIDQILADILEIRGRSMRKISWFYGFLIVLSWLLVNSSSNFSINAFFLGKIEFPIMAVGLLYFVSVFYFSNVVLDFFFMSYIYGGVRGGVDSESLSVQRMMGVYRTPMVLAFFVFSRPGEWSTKSFLETGLMFALQIFSASLICMVIWVYLHSLCFLWDNYNFGNLFLFAFSSLFLFLSVLSFWVWGRPSSDQ